MLKEIMTDATQRERTDASPLVSVAMCVFNGERQVGRAIEDILAQTYENFELIISNDGSTDGTAKIVESYSGDSRIRLFSHAVNKGFLANKNFAISEARGALITQQDHDDRSDPNRLARQVQAIRENGVAVAACGVRRLNASGMEVGRMAAARDLVLHAMPAGELPFFFPPTMFTRQIWESNGPFNEYFAGSYGEDNYFISSILRTHPIAVISDCLYDYIDTSHSVTSRIRSNRALTMVPILHHLAKQNSTEGTNDLEQRRFDLLESMEHCILSDRRYVAEQFRIYAARAVDHNDFVEGLRLLAKSAVKYPFSIEIIKTLFYLLRRIAERAK